MEFVGQIKKILTPREGVSERTGNEWKTIGAVPKKLGDQLWAQFLEACNTFFEARNAATAGTRNEEKENLKQKRNIIAQLKEYMKVRIGFGHKTREITRKDGTKTIINEVTLYKFELLDGAAHHPEAQTAQTAAVDNQQANQPAEAQKAADGEQKDKKDDLPF